MKKHLFFIWSMLVMLSTTTCFADSPISHANQQLRHMFQYVTNPNPNVKFLYQMGSHIIDSAYYSTQCTLTTNSDIWFYAYKELGWCAYDTTWMESDSSVYMRACDVYADTITFGIMDWRYNSLDYKAFMSDQYFYFDLTNNQLISNNTNQSDAYAIGEIFMSSPLLATSQTDKPIFKISPSFIFSTNDIMDNMSTQYDCYIDFDDGNGPQLVSLTSTNYHHTSYSTPGYHVLQTTIRLRSDTSVIVKRSNSGFVVSSTPALKSTDYTNLSSQFQGLKVYQFDPICDMGGSDDKVIFILAGYNPWSWIKYFYRGASDLYKKYIVDGHREILRQFGYTFVIVEWEDANRSISQNASYVMNLLEYYKCNKTGKEQFVLIGESMGSLVGRYALTYMESPYYISPNDCCLNLKHNVRLFISNDGPHLGANIPLSLQELVAAGENDNELAEYIHDMFNVVSLTTHIIRNRMLNGNSVKQMLLYHYSTENNGRYAAHQYHDDYLDDIEDIGGYPHLCKNVALSNGSLLGYHQQQCFDSIDAGFFRYPNDDLLELDCYSEFHVLGMSFDSRAYVDVKTNPNGNGPLLNVSVTSSFAHLSLYWFGIGVVKEQEQHVKIDKYGYNLIPYCVSAGGAIWANDGYAGDCPFLDFGHFLLGFQLNTSPGSFSLTLNHGIPWLIGGVAHVSVHTDGLGFCLVPIQSAFCYDPSHLNYHIDYTALSTTTMFSNTIFDVLSGLPNRDKSNRYNGLHETYRNEIFKNQLTGNSRYNYNYYTNDECSWVNSRILNREIGDEELFLDNSQINGAASYSALIALYVNYPHPYYNFDGQISTTYKIPGMYCRTNPFVIQSAGFANLQYGLFVNYSNLSGAFEKNQVLFETCCNNIVPHRANEADNNPLITTSPNPISIGDRLRISSDCPISNVQLYDVTGLFVASIPVESDISGMIFVTIPPVRSSGLYYLNLIGEDDTSQTKIYIY
ncbi:MAG: T9SS type A sorting domain-containing protein [Bacteroidales bacterium]|nr:T9SS type A sorting domain-containing protein [Bacteroidales bacterium]